MRRQIGSMLTRLNKREVFVRWTWSNRVIQKQELLTVPAMERKPRSKNINHDLEEPFDEEFWLKVRPENDLRQALYAFYYV